MEALHNTSCSESFQGILSSTLIRTSEMTDPVTGNRLSPERQKHTQSALRSVRKVLGILSNPRDSNRN